MRELRHREIIRSFNNPVADIAEWMAAKAFQLTLERNSAKAYDAVDGAGLRYQIKSRRITAANTSTQLGVMRDLESAQFDILLALYFTEEFEIRAAYRIPHAAVLRHARFSRAQRGHIITLTRSLLQDAACTDITGECRMVDLR